MIRKYAVLFLLFSQIIVPLTFAAELTKRERREVLNVVERQRDFFEAKITNDWKKIYSFLSPRLKSIVSLKQFILQPHLPGGVLMPESSRGGSIEKLLKRRYVPTNIAYKIRQVDLNADRNFAKVSSDVDQPLPPPMPQITISVLHEEYWKKVDGIWYLEWDVKYLVHFSGATQRAKAKSYIPKFKYSINLKELAEWYLDKIEKFEEESLKHDLIERALLIDPYNATLKIRKNKIDAGELPLKHIEKALLGRRLHKGWFTSYMEAGYWYEVVGDYLSARKNYISAYRDNPSSEAAVSGVIATSVKAGDLELGAKYQIRLLEISSITGSKPSIPKEFLSLSCKSCKNLKKETSLLLAKELVASGRYREAYLIYKNLLDKTKQFQNSIARLKKGKKVKLSNLFKPEFLKAFSQLTYHEIGSLLKEAKIDFFHPSDFSEVEINLDKSLIVESSPKLHQVTYGNTYVQGHIEAKSKILWQKSFSKNDSKESGYLALFSKTGEVTGSFYPDDNKNMGGSKKLTEEIGKLKKGSLVVLSRLSSAPHPLNKAFIDGLTSVGVDAATLQKSFNSQVIVFQKKKGYSKVWHGKGRIKKIFTASNLKEFKKSGRASVFLTGKSGKAKVKLFLPKKQR